MSWPVESAVPASAVKFADMETAPLPRNNLPVGSELKVFVTNVHNVAMMRFFVMVKNTANMRVLERIREATKAPFGHKCLRFPREGNIFGIRYAGNSQVLRAVRLPTVCFTTKREIVLPDLGRKELIDEKDPLLDMFHLPIDLRKPPSMAICCQLQGINDDVTIVPDMLREVLPGLLFQNLTLRVDGYIGAILKVQLLGVELETLRKWQSAIGAENKNAFYFALDQFGLTPEAAATKQKRSNEKANENQNENENEKQPASQKNNSKENSKVSYTVARSLLSEYEADKDDNSDDASSFGLAELFEVDNQSEQKADFQPLSNSSLVEKDADVAAAPKNATVVVLRPVLGFKVERNLKTPLRALLGRSPASKNVKIAAMRHIWKGWKHDSQAIVTIVDKRSRQYQCVENAILVITPTYIGQLERFFGVIHEPGKPYLQHMWTDDEIVWSTRYVHGNRPLLFDIVLAKHCSDYNWYRAKVIEVLQDSEMVRVFFVDYGGECYVKLKNLARLSRKIASMPFQATLFRLHALHDATASINEHSLAVNILRNSLLKETILVSVVKCDPEQLVISFKDGPNKEIPDLMVRKGFMTASG